MVGSAESRPDWLEEAPKRARSPKGQVLLFTYAFDDGLLTIFGPSSLCTVFEPTLRSSRRRPSRVSLLPRDVFSARRTKNTKGLQAQATS